MSAVTFGPGFGMRASIAKRWLSKLSPRRRHYLKNLVVDRVDLVDKGANQYAHVLIAKRAEDRTMMMHNDDLADNMSTFHGQLGDALAATSKSLSERLLDAAETIAHQQYPHLSKQQAFAKASAERGGHVQGLIGIVNKLETVGDVDTKALRKRDEPTKSVESIAKRAAWAQIETVAEQIIRKHNGTMKQAKAITEAMRLRPDLVMKYYAA